jgi:hypothetical protein
MDKQSHSWHELHGRKGQFGRVSEPHVLGQSPDAARRAASGLGVAAGFVGRHYSGVVIAL